MPQAPKENKEQPFLRTTNLAVQGAAFARNVSKASVEKYAEAYNLKLAGGTNTWQQMLEECCQHYRTEQEVHIPYFT